MARDRLCLNRTAETRWQRTARELSRSDVRNGMPCLCYWRCRPAYAHSNPCFDILPTLKQMLPLAGGHLWLCLLFTIGGTADPSLPRGWWELPNWLSHWWPALCPFGFRQRAGPAYSKLGNLMGPPFLLFGPSGRTKRDAVQKRTVARSTLID